ncbi:MAG: thiamine phosphate synthase [Planctomycetaceae bacterium]|nr:thiamine phosphate synthase [Planctomycetaceae bacterium]
MHQHRLTESACRAIEEAAILAVAAGYARVEPVCLLRAVLLEESRASEILERCGVSLATFDQRSLSGACEIELRDDSIAAGEDAAPLQHSAVLDEVIQEARRQSEMTGRHADVGSEHLLWGLAIVDSPMKDLLNSKGVDESFLIEHVAEASGITVEPLDADIHLTHREPTATDNSETYRVLDAAANRAREGLRVVEDFTRFTLDDPHLSRLLKQYRHELSETVGRLDSSALLKSRDTPNDVGTNVTTHAETVRRSPLDVAQANFKRVQEALRTLEEFGKIIAPTTAERIEQLRYSLYTLEKATLGTHAARTQFDGINLYLLVTERLCHHGSGPAVRDAIDAGARIVQVREKTMSDRALIDHGCRVRSWTRDADALFIMNDRADLAVLTDADGVHVGQEELTVREARQIVGSDRLVGVSTHTIEQARQAVLDGADYIGVGPVFPSKTKQFDEFVGLEFVRQVAAEITLPWFAIGGIDQNNINEVIAAGASRVAVSSAICSAEKPAEATRGLTAAFSSQPPE